MRALPDEILRDVFFRVDPRTFYSSVTRVCRRWNRIAESIPNGSDGALPVRLTLKLCNAGYGSPGSLVGGVKLLSSFQLQPAEGKRTFVASEATLAVSQWVFQELEENNGTDDGSDFFDDELRRAWTFHVGFKVGKSQPKRVQAVFGAIWDDSGYWIKYKNPRCVASFIASAQHLARMSVTWPFFRTWQLLDMAPLATIKHICVAGAFTVQADDGASQAAELRVSLSVVPNLTTLDIGTIIHPSFLASLSSIPSATLSSITKLRLTGVPSFRLWYNANEVLLLNKVVSHLPNLQSLGDIILRPKMWNYHPEFSFNGPPPTQNISTLWIRSETVNDVTFFKEKDIYTDGATPSILTGFVSRFPNLYRLHVCFADFGASNFPPIQDFHKTWMAIISTSSARNFVFSGYDTLRSKAMEVPRGIRHVLREICGDVGKEAEFEQYEDCF